MNRVGATVIFVLFGPVGLVAAQSPNGTIAGVVTDSSGGVIAEAEVGITNRDTGQVRTITTSTAGTYSASALPPGEYRVSAQAVGFKRVTRDAIVETGTTTTVDLALELGEVRDTVTVSAALPLMRYDHHQVGGVITRPQVENLPLNGRNFLELVKLEPGVTDPVRGTNNRVFVAALGSGLQPNPRVGYTRVTVDGANINSLGAIGASLQVSQEVVQEFQLSTANFDLSTGLTSNGSINIVTRSGSNDFHGSAFYFYRDHNLAAYPGLRRDPGNPHPLFERHQFGYQNSGPLRKDRAFFFTNYERTNQQGVVSVQPRTPEFAALGGIFPSPYSGNQFSARVDLRMTSRHSAFARYTHDGNRAFAPLNDRTDVLPSGWSRFANRADQTLAAFTSVLSSAVVSDLRLSYFFLDSSDGPGGPEECVGCFGLGVPRINIPDAGLVFGNPRTVSVVGQRYQITESLTWQKNRHLFRFGFDREHATSTSSNITQDPAALTLWSPAQVRQRDPTILLPASFTSVDHILRLPLRIVSTGVGPGIILQRGFRPTRVFDLYRLYGSDTWRAGPHLTINYGLAWSYEPNVLNHDLTKPALLIPILGRDNLKPPAAEAGRFSPTLGFAWSATDNGRTVLRGGAGRYFDPVGSANPFFLGNERFALLPLGTGRVVVPGSSISCDGRVLDFPRPTSFTAAQSLTCLSAIRDELLASLNPSNQDFSLRNIDRNKVGENLVDPFFSTPSAVHLGLGVQRQLARDFAISADFVWRQFSHTFITGIDYNRWNSVGGPVIPACTDAQKNDVQAPCSNGSITFDATIGRARYKGLLVRADKRFSRRTQFLVSYALGSYVGTNGTASGAGFNNDNWFENYGPLPTDLRHVLNMSGYVELPWQFQVAFSVSANSRPPFSAIVSGVDFGGDGTGSDLLPGTGVNQFNRGLDAGDLARLVDRYNQEVAGKPRCCKQDPAPPITLPANYSFNDRFFTQDVRLSRTFLLGAGGAGVQLFAEVFNLLNTANLIQYGNNLANSATFGQPGARFEQVFGSGGPRTAQLGARVSF
jgi:hypothetical protein